MKWDQGQREKILSDALEVIEAEARAVGALNSSLGDGFVDAVQEIAMCTGKIVALGIGKSGFVARKLSSTLASTGTSAIFLHPAEASHGDLGIVNRGDCVVAISKSGESAEINLLLEPIRSLGARLIAITSESQSTMAKAADHVISYSIDREACPLNLVPTSSVMASLAIADAIAVSLMHLKNFRPAEFAVSHPGGQLGRRLLRKVRDVMVPFERCFAISKAEINLDRIVHALGQNLLGMVLVTGAQDSLEAIVTDGDLRRSFARHREKVFSTPVAEFWNASPTTLDPDFVVQEALDFIQNLPKPLNVLPVVSGGRAVGIVRLHDLIK